MTVSPHSVRAYGLRSGWRLVQYLAAGARGIREDDGVPVFPVPDREAVLSDAIRRINVGSYR